MTGITGMMMIQVQFTLVLVPPASAVPVTRTSLSTAAGRRGMRRRRADDAAREPGEESREMLPAFRRLSSINCWNIERP